MNKMNLMMECTISNKHGKTTKHATLLESGVTSKNLGQTIDDLHILSENKLCEVGKRYSIEITIEEL